MPSRKAILTFIIQNADKELSLPGKKQQQQQNKQLKFTFSVEFGIPPEPAIFTSLVAKQHVMSFTVVD